jgi:hypothetical protein
VLVRRLSGAHRERFYTPSVVSEQHSGVSQPVAVVSAFCFRGSDCGLSALTLFVTLRRKELQLHLRQA